MPGFSEGGGLPAVGGRAGGPAWASVRELRLHHATQQLLLRRRRQLCQCRRHLGVGGGRGAGPGVQRVVQGVKAEPSASGLVEHGWLGLAFTGRRPGYHPTKPRKVKSPSEVCGETPFHRTAHLLSYAEG